MSEQCESCKLKDTRACVWHGYPIEAIPSSCSYKLGFNAEEALRNLNGTFIDVWTKEHDAAIAAQARKEERERVLEKVKHIIEYNDDLFQYVGNHILKQKVVAYDFLLSDEGIESLRGDNK